MHYGIDISSNNAHPMAYGAIVGHLGTLGEGAQPFVVVKITQGTGYVNPDAAADIAGFRSAGAVVAGYLMDQGNDPVASEEALFNQRVKLPQADDIELPEGLSVAQYVEHSRDLDLVDPAAIDYLNQSEVTEGFPQGAGLWLAEFNNEPGVTSHPCLMHQYDNVGTIPGAAGSFDMDVWCGSEAQFEAFFCIAPPVTPIKKGPTMYMTVQDNEMWLCSGNTAMHILDGATPTLYENAGVPTIAIPTDQFALYVKVG